MTSASTVPTRSNDVPKKTAVLAKAPGMNDSSGSAACTHRTDASTVTASTTAPVKVACSRSWLATHAQATPDRLAARPW